MKLSLSSNLLFPIPAAWTAAICSLTDQLLTSYQVGRWEQQRGFERVAALFSNLSCKTQIFHCVASVSQGICPQL